MLPSTRRCLHLNNQQFTESIWSLLYEDALLSTIVLEDTDNQDMDKLGRKVTFVGDKVIYLKKKLP